MTDTYFFSDLAKKLQAFIEGTVRDQIANHSRKMDSLIEELETSKYATFGIARKMTDLNEEFSMLGAEVQRTFEEWQGAQLNQAEWKEKVDEALRQLATLQAGHAALVKDYFTLKNDVEENQSRIILVLEQVREDILALRRETQQSLVNTERRLNTLESEEE